MHKKILSFIITILIVLCFPLDLCRSEESILYIFGKEGAGDFDNEYLKRTNPDFRWIGIDVDQNNDAQNMALQIRTKNDCFDMFAMGYAYCGLTLLNEKGFCMDLSRFSELTELAKRYHPYIRKAIWSDGKLFAIPIDVSISGWAYNKHIAEVMGLQQMPSTYSELFDLLAWWLEEGSDLFPEYEVLIGPENYRKALCSTMIRDYVNYCTLNGIGMNFQDDIMTSLMQKLDSLDTDELERLETLASIGIAYDKPSLLVIDCNYSDLAGNEAAGLIPLKIGITEEDKTFIADVYCFAVNALTIRSEMACTYITTFVENYDEESRIKLFCDQSVTPIENPDYYTDLEINTQQRQAILENSSLDDEERNELLTLNENEKDLIERARWYISSKQLQNYIELTRNTAVRHQNILEKNSTSGTLEIQRLIDRYAEKTMSAEEFARQSNNILQQILYESE